MKRRRRRQLAPWAAGVIGLVVVVLIVYFAFTKSSPFSSPYTLKARFANASTLKTNAPVRIAGVDVGKVTKIEHASKGGPGALVSFTVSNEGRPVHSDATAKIRERIFLEGNEFLDLHPGTPSAPQMRGGATIPAGHTAQPVQLGQVLSVLNRGTRSDLKQLLANYAIGLSGRGARDFNRSIPYWKAAYQKSSEVNQALQGRRPHDLSGYIDAGGRVAGAADAHPDHLRSLVSNFDLTAAAFARQQSNLEQTVAELPTTLSVARPALAALDRALPPTDALIDRLKPAVHSALPAINASLPLVHQLRLLVRPSELRGLVADLRPTIPALASFNHAGAKLFPQVRLTSSCMNNVILPFAHETVPDGKFPAQGQVYQEFSQQLPGLAGESRTGDANGQWFRILATPGESTLKIGTGKSALFSQVSGPLFGVNPVKPDGPNGGVRPPIRPGVPCETQGVPDLRSTPAGTTGTITHTKPSAAGRARRAKALDYTRAWLEGLMRKRGLLSGGKR
jgi:virulence factor Mce-like protein